MSTCRMWQPVSPPASRRLPVPDDVELGGDVVEGGMSRGRLLQRQQRVGGPGSASANMPGTRSGEDPDAVGARRARRPAPSIRPDHRRQGEPPRQGGSGAEPGRVAADPGQQPPCVVEPAGERAVDHRRNRTGGEHADRAGGPQHLGDGRPWRPPGSRRTPARCGRAPDPRSPRRPPCARSATSPWTTLSGTFISAARRAAAASESGLGIDHRHVMAQAGQRHGEPPVPPPASRMSSRARPAARRARRSPSGGCRGRPRCARRRTGSRPARRTDGTPAGWRAAAPVPSSAPATRGSPATANLPVPRSAPM